eukprot:gene8469-biopygen3060
MLYCRSRRVLRTPHSVRASPSAHAPFAAAAPNAASVPPLSPHGWRFVMCDGNVVTTKDTVKSKEDGALTMSVYMMKTPAADEPLKTPAPVEREGCVDMCGGRIRPLHHVLAELEASRTRPRTTCGGGGNVWWGRGLASIGLIEEAVC